MPARSEEARERAKAAARAKYAEDREQHRRVDIKGFYRGPRENGELESEGQDPGCCPGCGDLYKPQDFTTDRDGILQEPTLCVGCRSS